MQTQGGKEIELYTDGFAIRVRFKGGGELPAALSGSWTTKVFAEDAVRKYLAEAPPKKEKYKPELNKEDYAK